MFLKEAISILIFGASTLGISGFAIKVDKFEYNYLVSNELNLSVESYRKLQLRKGSNFYYLENEKSKVLKITDIKVISPKSSEEAEYIQLSLSNQGSYLQTNLENTNKIIKYFLESKPFWMNLFS
ncbi:hypothetical protein OVS_00300 [Mycoplasma ovis str. Michigan]|uniref:Uncharacterized protein n=1 Tax=Mycoplasma ovis str. Michigan TaxID=1415773 RepID=A0ABN4BQX1_9MOLU|nr:hypothetical protein [Mycoplasma ovis]AHC40089.1 hypothetical protein OVS_00300 [Mycoplasma ovis str. Michigan]